MAEIVIKMKDIIMGIILIIILMEDHIILHLIAVKKYAELMGVIIVVDLLLIQSIIAIIQDPLSSHQKLAVAQKQPVVNMVAIIVALLIHIHNIAVIIKGPTAILLNHIVTLDPHTLAVPMVAATMVLPIKQIKDVLEIFAHNTAATIVDHLIHIQNIQALIVHLMVHVERSF